MWNIIITGIGSLLTDISTEMFYPLISFYLLALGAGPSILGFVEGIAESLASLLKVYSGYISDKIQKRKPLAILGYSFSSIGKVILYLAENWVGIFIGRFIDRFGKGIRTAPRDAIIAESSKEKERGKSFGLHRAMDTIGAALGVVLAIYIIKNFNLDETSNLKEYIPAFKSIILFSLIPALLGVGILFLLKETGKSSSRGNLPSLKWKKLDPKLRAFLIFTFIFTLGNSSNQFLLLRAKTIEENIRITTVLSLYLLYNVIYAIFSFPAGYISDKIGRKRVLVLGYLFYGLVYLGFAIANKFNVLVYLFVAYGLYIAFTEGVEKALISDLAPPETKATVIGLHATLVGIGLFPASLLAGLLWSYFGPQAPFYFGGFLGILASIGLMSIL
ncbi:MAG: MFS transporter [Dictyoglomus sp.]|nr:MFS transporter [Dictyoglomus sp.]MCX7942725.1 MFS transporter [Dictyoglomaceae bacterium]MDW8189261.1 MFS transporter [Dictyoglomus sp.]